MLILRQIAISSSRLLSTLLLLFPWHIANAQCYQFSSGSTASLTLNITNLPQPIVSSDTHGVVTHKYDFRGLPGNRAKAVVGAAISTSSEFPILKEASNESTFSLTIAYGPDTGTTFEVLVVANAGLMEAHVFLHARADRGHPKGLLPDGLPPILPPPSAWSEATFLGIILNQRHAYIPVSGKVDTIHSCTGTSDQPPPPPQACGPLTEAHRNHARLSLQDAPEPGPFNFREAYLLEHRMEIEWKAEHFNPSHGENMRQLEGPSPAQPMIPDLNDPAIYLGSRWMGLLSEADRFLQMGGFKVSEARYLTILDKLTEAQGPCSDSVAYMYGRLGELYLRLRDFDRAYASLLAAVQTRRNLIQAAKDDRTRDFQRLQLMGLLDRLGELDLGRGDLDRADEELAEAAAICNDPSCLRDAQSLFALYFRSLVLERQGKWRQAEELWLQATEARQELLPREHSGTGRAAEVPSPQATQTREEMLASEFYWNALKEMAAFYARHGAIHEAATIARQVVKETGKPLKIDADMFDEAPPAFTRFAQYRIESNLAMSEILALDAWQSSGPAAAAALLTDPDPLDMLLLDHGTDADRAQLLAWVQRRVFLYMSILLDGASSGKNVDRAYEQLMATKGHLLTSQRDLMRILERSWNNPNVDMPERLALLNQLSQERTHHAHLFMTGILGDTPLDRAEIAGAELTEASITAALSADPASEYVRGFPSRPKLESDEAMIEFVEWQRTDRRTLTLLPREYGAFVSTAGAPVHFVTLGPAAEIDQDIELLTLTAKVIKGKSTRDLQSVLRRLYTKVLAPLALWLPRPSSRGIPRIFVIPHGKLTLAPIAALLDPDGRYFLERYQVSYMVDSQAFFEVADSGWSTSRPVVFANPDFTMSVDGSDGARPWPSRLPLKPLPGSATEAAEVVKLLGLAPDHLLLGKLAREEVVRGLLGPKLLHFATHSVANIARDPSPAPWRLFEFPDPLSAQNPFLHSYIALAGANRQQTGPEDGLLTALEVQSLHMGGTELVVLSSCESGFGTTVDGLGLTGLRAAFWRAGAKGLVANLWPADDEASHRFMSFFYSHLAHHSGPAEALRQAQLDMVKTTDFSPPFYWAGYSYTGRSQPLQLAPSSGDTPRKEREILVNPICIEISAHTSRNGQANHHKLLIQLGPMARLQERSAVKAVYEFFFPGSDVEYSESVSVEGGPPVVNFFTRVASRLGDRILLIVNRSQKESSIVIQTLSTRIAAGTPLYSVMLKGDPELFSSLAVPQALPPLVAYREATLGGTASAPVTIDRIATCPLESSTQ